LQIPTYFFILDTSRRFFSFDFGDSETAGLNPQVRHFEPVRSVTELKGADLGRARKLTQEQLNISCGDKDAILAAGLSKTECPQR
jgi:hypothetical protein